MPKKTKFFYTESSFKELLGIGNKPQKNKSFLKNNSRKEKNKNTQKLK